MTTHGNYYRRTELDTWGIAMTENRDLSHIRKYARSQVQPKEWPAGVFGISQSGLGLLGIHEKTDQLYWDGQPLVTEKRWSTVERRIAMVGLIIAAIGVAATVVQAWVALAATRPTNYQVCLETFERGWTEANGQLAGADRIQSLSVCEHAL